MQLVSVTVNLTLNMSILDLQWNNIKINLHGIDFFRTLYNNFLSKSKTFLLLKKKTKQAKNNTETSTFRGFFGKREKNM